MNRFLAIVMIATFFVACVERVDATPTRLKRDKSTTSETAGAELPGDDDDDDDTTPAPAKPKPPETKVETPATPPPPPPPLDPFDGAGAFAGNPPAKESTDHHQGSSNQGKECMGCHSAGKGAPTFSFGGTIRATKTSLEGAAGVEVRIVDEKGAQIALTTSDSVGNFWFKGTVEIPGGARVAIRTAGGAQKMSERSRPVHATARDATRRIGRSSSRTERRADTLEEHWTQRINAPRSGSRRALS